MTSHDKPRFLGSWKEIAAFLGRDVRTVQRWEGEGLPVHRRPGAKRSGVFAYDHELETWLGLHTVTGDKPESRSDPPARTTRRPSPRFVAAAAIVAMISAGLAWVAAMREGPESQTPSPRLLALSITAIQMPRWADVDGNGDADLLVSPETSPVLIFRSARSKRCGADAQTCADTRIHMPAFCHPHTTAADFNGDGLDDVLVSCVLREPETFAGTGPTFIVWGRRAWPAALTLPADAGVTIATDVRRDERVHGCLSGSGPADLNGDGIADVLIGGGEAGFKDRLSAGSLYVFFGRRAWPSSLPFSGADVTIGGSRMAEGFGALCAAGDFDGDGLLDLAGYADEERLWRLLGGSGRAYVIRGRAEWPRVIDLAHEPAMRIDGLPSGTVLQQLAMADIDHDGRDDLFFAAPASIRNPDEGSVVSVWKGGPLRAMPSKFSEADAVIKGASPASRFGVMMASADLDRDGHREMLISDPGAAAFNVLTEQSLDRARAFPHGVIKTGRALPSERASMAYADGMVAIVAFDAGVWRLSLFEPFSPVSIDVRPHNADDVIVRPGVAAVGILGRRGAPPVAADSLRAAGARPIAHTVTDINGDGVPDLVGRFKTEEMNLGGDATSLTVIGRTRRGGYVRGESPVRVVSVAAATRR